MEGKMEYNESIRKLLQKQFPQLKDGDLPQQQTDNWMAGVCEKIGMTQENLMELIMQNRKQPAAFEVNRSAFQGLPDHQAGNKVPMTESYPFEDETKKHFPPTHAPEDLGFDAGIIHTFSENDPRR